MSSINLQLRIYYLFIALWIIGSAGVTAQTMQNAEQLHEVTIFVMPTLHPIDWESPAKLYKTMYSCFIKTVLVPDNYLLGHLAVQISTPLLPQPILTGMVSASPSERLDYIYNKKIGFSILGVPLKGRLETSEELKHKLATYTKRNKLAFITYKISEQSAKRIIHFIENYSKPINNKPAQSNYYGGAFWPRYENEGAGCSAFGMAILDVAHLLDSVPKQWQVKVNIPMNIIGGEYNDNKKVNISSVRKTKYWYTGPGKENIDYIPYEVYEPSIIFEWILKQRSIGDSRFQPVEKDGAPGLYFDGNDISASTEMPAFTERSDSNLFINKFLEKIQFIPVKKQFVSP
jgi:hypothetical protein